MEGAVSRDGWPWNGRAEVSTASQSNGEATVVLPGGVPTEDPLLDLLLVGSGLDHRVAAEMDLRVGPALLSNRVSPQLDSRTSDHLSRTRFAERDLRERIDPFPVADPASARQASEVLDLAQSDPGGALSDRHRRS